MMLYKSVGPGHAPDMPKRKPSGLGGWRPGAGRKPTLHDPVSFTGQGERADMDVPETIAERRGVSIGSLVRTAVAAYVKRQKRR